MRFRNMCTYIVPKSPPPPMGVLRMSTGGLLGTAHAFLGSSFKPGAFSCPEMILIYPRRNAFTDIPGCYTISTVLNKQSQFDYRPKIIRKGDVFTFSVSRSSYCDADAGIYRPKRKMI